MWFSYRYLFDMHYYHVIKIGYSYNVKYMCLFLDKPLEVKLAMTVLVFRDMSEVDMV